MNPSESSAASTRRERHATVGLRLATRLARYEVLRRPGRTLLVAVLVAVPVAGMLVADVMVRTEHLTPLQYWRSQNGQADATFSYTDAPPSSSSAIGRLLAKSRVIPGTLYVDAPVLHTVNDRRSAASVITLPMADPLARGIVQVMSGRAPVRGNEVFLTRVAAHELGVRAGDTLRLKRPARTSFVVTGVGEVAAYWGQTAMIVPPTTRLPWTAPRAAVPVTAPAPAVTALEVRPQLVDLPAGVQPTELKRLVTSHAGGSFGFQVSPALVRPPRGTDYSAADAQRKVRWSWVVGALVLTVAGIVIAAAFAVGARRQLVTLGQLAANGAPPKLLRRVLFLQGTWTGIVGALLGVGLGAGALAALAPHADSLFKKDVHPYAVRPFDLIPIVVLGVVTATVAALLPARTTSRIPVLAALAGRRPLGSVPKWLPIAGACVAAAGLGLFGLAVLGANSTSSGDSANHWQVWALTAIVGGVALLLGACAVAPAYVTVLEPAAARAQGSRRIAMRSLARQRTRTGAVVSAIAATGALAIAASSLVLSVHQHDVQTNRYLRPNELQVLGQEAAAGDSAPPAALVAAEQKVLPNARKLQITVATRKNIVFTIERIVPQHPTNDANVTDAVGTSFTAAIADRSALAEYGLSDRDQRTLAARGALLIGSVTGRAMISITTQVAPTATAPKPRTFDVPMVESGKRYPIATLPSLLVSRATATRLDLTPQKSTVILRTPKPLTADQRARVSETFTNMIQDAGADGWQGNIDFYRPPGGVDPRLIQWVLVGIALLLVLFVVAVNLTLSATETRDERDVLTIVGASPASMRQANGYKALLLSCMGALLAIPVGFLPAAVFLGANTRHLPIVFPWQIVLALVVVLPVAAGIITTAASAIALRARPVRISTMAYD